MSRYTGLSIDELLAQTRWQLALGALSPEEKARRFMARIQDVEVPDFWNIIADLEQSQLAQSALTTPDPEPQPMTSPVRLSDVEQFLAANPELFGEPTHAPSLTVNPYDTGTIEPPVAPAIAGPTMPPDLYAVGPGGPTRLPDEQAMRQDTIENILRTEAQNRFLETGVTPKAESLIGHQQNLESLSLEELLAELTAGQQLRNETLGSQQAQEFGIPARVAMGATQSQPLLEQELDLPPGGLDEPLLTDPTFGVDPMTLLTQSVPEIVGEMAGAPALAAQALSQGAASTVGKLALGMAGFVTPGEVTRTAAGQQTGEQAAETIVGAGAVGAGFGLLGKVLGVAVQRLRKYDAQVADRYARELQAAQEAGDMARMRQLGTDLRAEEAAYRRRLRREPTPEETTELQQFLRTEEVEKEAAKITPEEAAKFERARREGEHVGDLASGRITPMPEVESMPVAPASLKPELPALSKTERPALPRPAVERPALPAPAPEIETPVTASTPRYTSDEFVQATLEELEKTTSKNPRQRRAFKLLLQEFTHEERGLPRPDIAALAQEGDPTAKLAMKMAADNRLLFEPVEPVRMPPVSKAVDDRVLPEAKVPSIFATPEVEFEGFGKESPEQIEKSIAIARRLLSGGGGIPGGAGFVSGGIDFSVGAAREALQTALEAVKKADVTAGRKLGIKPPIQSLKHFADSYATQMVDRVGRQGGAVGKVVREKARRANALFREIHERLAPHEIEVQEKLGARPHKLLSKKQTAIQKARKRLQEYEPGEANADALYSRGRLTVEDLKRQPASAEEKTIIEDVRRWLRESGTLAQEYDVKRLIGGEIQTFQRAIKENKLPRLATPDMYRIVQQEGGEFNHLVQILADENEGLTLQQVSRTLKELYGPDSTRVLGMFERQRMLKNFPDAMRYEGTTIPLLETDPVSIIASGTNVIAARLSFLRVFGQEFAEVAGQEAGGLGLSVSRLEKLGKRFVKAGGSRKDFNDLTKTLNWRPVNRLMEEGVTQRSLIGTGAWDVANPIFQALALSTSSVWNLAETAGALRGMIGTRRWLTSLADIARHPIQKRSELAHMGAVSRKLLDWHLRKGRKAFDLGRLMRETGVKTSLVDFANEANETVAAQGGRRMAEELLARGQLHKPIRFRDLSALRRLGFRDRILDRLKAGKMTPREAKNFVRELSARSAGFTQGSGVMAMSERSALANTPWFRQVVDFQTFNQAVMNNYGSIGRELGRAFAKGSAREQVAAIRHLADTLVGTAAAGAAVTWLGALLYGQIAEFGKGGLDTAWKMLVQGGISGPLRALQYIDPERQNVIEMLGTLVPKARLVTNVGDMIFDQGRFADKIGFAENTLELFKAQTPVTKVAGLYLMLTGQTDPKIEHAVRRYWRWRGEQPDIRWDPGKKKGDDLTRKARKELQRALRAGDSAGAQAALERAFTAGMTNVRESDRLAQRKAPRTEASTFYESGERLEQSLNGMKLLSNLSPLHRERIREDLSGDVYRQLEIHDELIDTFIRTVLRPQRKSGTEKRKVEEPQ